MAVAIAGDQAHSVAIRTSAWAAATAFAYHLPGGETVIVGGAYRSIEPPSKIVFSWLIEPPDEHAGIESEVTITITPDRGGAELVIRHEKFARTDAVVRHAEGWRGALDQLTALLEARGGRMIADYDLAASVRAALSGGQGFPRGQDVAGSASC